MKIAAKRPKRDSPGHALGFEPRTIARQEIEADALITSGVRVLILPFVVSLSDREVQKIRQFVTSGGMIIADYRCGLRDGHGRMRAAGALDDVFGIERQSTDVRRGRAVLTADIGGGVRFESVFHDPVRPAGAETRAFHDDGTQAFFTHHHSGGDHDTFGWYRMRLRTPAEFAGKKLYLVFEAVDEDAHIYINGQKAFEHSCESTGLVPDDIWNQPFVADVSGLLRPGEQDLLVVGVYNRHGMGGIHKAVDLIAADAELDLEAAQAQVRSRVDTVALTDWRFALDENNEGMAERWYAEDYNAAAWKTMRTDLYTGWQGQGFSGGKAVYLNTDLYSYIDLRRRGKEHRLRKALADLLVHQADLYPPFVIQQRQGSPAGRVEVTRFRDGETTYYGVLPSFDVDDQAARSVVLPFGDDVHVYDVRAQKYLGPGGPIADTLYPGQARMYAALPYAIDGVTVDPPKRARQGESVEIAISVDAQFDKLGPHAVRIEVSLPDGSTPEYLTQTLYLPHGRGTWSFVPALNSPRGRWSVMVVEAVCGEQATAHFDVRAVR